MKLTEYSKNRLLRSMSTWHVTQDLAEPVYNYLVHGFSPGGFLTALLANDAMGAIARSHPANSIQNLKYLVGWILNVCPSEAWGNNNKIDNWLSKTPAERRVILEKLDLIYTEEQEVMAVLKNLPVADPDFII